MAINWNPGDLNLTMFGGDTGQIQQEYFKRVSGGKSGGGTYGGKVGMSKYGQWLKEQQRMQQYGVGAYGASQMAPPEAADASGVVQEERKRQRRGASSTMLTGAAGLQKPASLSRKMLLGGV